MDALMTCAMEVGASIGRLIVNLIAPRDQERPAVVARGSNPVEADPRIEFASELPATDEGRELKFATVVPAAPVPASAAPAPASGNRPCSPSPAPSLSRSAVKEVRAFFESVPERLRLFADAAGRNDEGWTHLLSMGGLHGMDPALAREVAALPQLVAAFEEQESDRRISELLFREGGPLLPLLRAYAGPQFLRWRLRAALTAARLDEARRLVEEEGAPLDAIAGLSEVRALHSRVSRLIDGWPTQRSTPLHLHAVLERADLAAALLQWKADPTAEDEVRVQDMVTSLLILIAARSRLLCSERPRRCTTLRKPAARAP
jgi:hypothetical protein